MRGRPRSDRRARLRTGRVTLQLGLEIGVKALESGQASLVVLVLGALQRSVVIGEETWVCHVAIKPDFPGDRRIKD